MAVWALADLHLSHGVEGKEMDRFGTQWRRHHDTIERFWKEAVAADDLVLVAGDVSWAMRLEDAIPDLDWLGVLPGVKVLVRGNHDYWWASARKVRLVLPPSVHIISNDVFVYGDVAVAGARLWDSDEYSFGDAVEEYVDFERRRHNGEEGGVYQKSTSRCCPRYMRRWEE